MIGVTREESELMIATTDKQRYLQHMDQFDKAQKTAPFPKVRQAARSRLRDLGFPTPKTEDWRFTSVAGLLKVPFELAEEGPVAARVLPALPTPGTLRLVFVNGVFAPELSTKVANGLEIGSLADVRDTQAQRLQEVLGLADYKGQIFTALNTSFLNDGAYVLVPEGKVIEEPVEVIYLSAPAGKATVTHPRTVLVAGKGSQVTVIERYLGEAGVYFTNAVTEIALADNAVVDHYKLQYESPEAYHIANTQIVQSRGSNFTTHYLSLGGNLVRNVIRKGRVVWSRN